MPTISERSYSDEAAAFDAESGPRLLLFAVMVSAAVLAGTGVAWLSQHQVPAAAIAALSSVGALVFIWLTARVLRIGVSFDDRGITVRNLIRTDVVSWEHVSAQRR